MIKCYKYMKERTIFLIDNHNIKPNNFQNSIKFMNRVKYFSTRRRSDETETGIESVNEINIRRVSGLGNPNKLLKEKFSSHFSQIYYQLEIQSRTLENLKKSFDSITSEEKNNNLTSEIKLEAQMIAKDKKNGNESQVTPRFLKFKI